MVPTQNRYVHCCSETFGDFIVFREVNAVDTGGCVPGKSEGGVVLAEDKLNAPELMCEEQLFKIEPVIFKKAIIGRVFYRFYKSGGIDGRR